MRLDVLSDPICPWCYIGRQHMQVALAELAGQGMRFTVAWRPFQLNPDMPVGGMPREPDAEHACRPPADPFCRTGGQARRGRRPVV